MRRVLLAIVTTVTGMVMLLSFKTQTVIAQSTAAAATKSAVVSSQPATASAGSTTATKTVTGSSVDTRWGPVQVQITVTGGKITSAVAVQYPNGNGRDQQINAYAVPVLQQETVKANSASIDMVSGATYTSTGYIASLQSALSQV